MDKGMVLGLDATSRRSLDGATCTPLSTSHTRSATSPESKLRVAVDETMSTAPAAVLPQVSTIPGGSAPSMATDGATIESAAATTAAAMAVEATALEAMADESGRPTVVSRVWSDLDKTKFFSAGAVATGTLLTIFHPFDVVKTLQQTAHGRPPPLLGTMAAMARTSPRSLWRGYAPSLVGAYVVDLVYYPTLELLKEGLLSAGFASPAAHGASALIAEAASNLVIVPFDVITVRLVTAAAAGRPASSTAAIAADVVRTQGVAGLMRGYTLTVATYGIESAMFWAIYAWLRDAGYALLHPPDQPCAAMEDRPLIHAAAGAVGGAIAGAATNPLDVIKTRVQASTAAVSPISSLSAFRAYVAAMVANEGWRVFAKGIPGRVGFLAPTMAATVTLYEMVKEFATA